MDLVVESGGQRSPTVQWRPVASAIIRAAVSLAMRPSRDGMHSLQHLVQVRFPSVPQISTAGLATWLSDQKRSRPLLLDIREREEFDVSHLARAIAIAPKARPEVVTILAGKKTPIVLYCSVGYRSSAFALRLINAGFADVQNLEGSIFQWANEGRPLEAGGKPVTRVHPYHPCFRRLLATTVTGEDTSSSPSIRPSTG